MGIIWTLLVGALAGWLAAKLMGVNEGSMVSCVIKIFKEKAKEGI